MEINNNLEDYCEKCPQFEIEVSVNSLYADDEVHLRICDISCKNSKLCERLRHYINTTNK